MAELVRQRPIHFIGIGGTGMCGLAKIFLQDGYRVTGSDTNDSAATRELRTLGAQIVLGQRGELITENTQLVVYTAAIAPDNRDFLKAEELNIPRLKYAQAVGEALRNRFGIAIAGTHGKTTTSAMIAFCMRLAGLDPSFIIGGTIPQLAGSSHAGKSDYFVIESCEFDRSFLNFSPRFALINNIEEDHLDYYSGIDEIVGAFRDFAARVTPEGALFFNMDCRRSAGIAAAHGRKAVSYGFHADAEFRGVGTEVQQGVHQFEVLHRGKSMGNFRLGVPGWHNVANALGVVALAASLDIPLPTVREALETFRGAERRFQLRAEINGITILDDYAHHPTEIETVVQTALHRYPGRRLWVVFQPHQYSRTRFLLKDFAEKLRYCDHVLLPEIYFVRDSERDRQLVSASHLAREIRGLGGNAVFIPTLSQIADYCINNLDPGDVIITMGAGDVWKIADELVRRIQGLH